MLSKTQLRPSVCLSFKSPIFASALASRAWWHSYHQRSSVLAVQVVSQRTPTGRPPERFHSSPPPSLAYPLLTTVRSFPRSRRRTLAPRTIFEPLQVFFEVCRRDGVWTARKDSSTNSVMNEGRGSGVSESTYKSRTTAQREARLR